MDKYSQVARCAACVISAATLIGCDAAAIYEEHSATLQDDISLPDDIPQLNDSSSFSLCAPVDVDLSGTRLLGHASATDTTFDVAVSIPDGRYEIHLHYEDRYHADPNQPDQLDEIWYLAGKKASGETALITNHTNDLPADETSGVTNVGHYDLVGIVSVSGHHASVSHQYDSYQPVYNSIEPVKAVFYNMASGCL